MRYSWLFFISILLLACNEPVARRPIHRNHVSKKDRTIAFNKALNKAQEQIIQKYVEKDSLLMYQNSSYGFVYSVVTPSVSKQKIDKGTEVTYLKTVYNLKDELIYGQKKVTSVVGKSNEITGIDEGLKLMTEDEEIKFIFTSFVAHGFYGDKNKIGRYTPIIVKIKILKINN